MPPVQRPPARSADVRDRLLQAAVELIPRRGWGSVSTRMIAEQAGVTPGLVHYHFGSVQALLSEAALNTIRALVEGIPALLYDARSTAQLLNMLFGALDSYQGTDPVSLLFSETYLAAGRDEKLRAQLSAVVTDFRAQLAALLAERGVADPAGTAAVLSAAIDGIVLHRALGLTIASSTVTSVLGRALLDQKGH